jgi:putative iron-dependent peroxidase
MAEQPPHSHLSHVELREGTTGDDSTAKRAEITRRSTPYAFPAPPTGGDGVTGLYFIGFCKDQAPLRERMEAMYGMQHEGQIRDRLTDFSNPASGSFYFAPSVEVLDRN